MVAFEVEILRVVELVVSLGVERRIKAGVEGEEILSRAPRAATGTRTREERITAGAHFPRIR
jgi:hypothetical protein